MSSKEKIGRGYRRASQHVTFTDAAMASLCAPCPTLPGSEQKIELLTARYHHGAELWHEHDTTYADNLHTVDAGVRDIDLMTDHCDL